jgi:hypothetical protein
LSAKYPSKEFFDFYENPDLEDTFFSDTDIPLLWDRKL